MVITLESMFLHLWLRKWNDPHSRHVDISFCVWVSLFPAEEIGLCLPGAFLPHLSERSGGWENSGNALADFRRMGIPQDQERKLVDFLFIEPLCPETGHVRSSVSEWTWWQVLRVCFGITSWCDCRTPCPPLLTVWPYTASSRRALTDYKNSFVLIVLFYRQNGCVGTGARRPVSCR